MNKLIAILPQNITGRIIISGLIEGFKSHRVEVDIFDHLTTNFKELYLDSSLYSYVLGHNYSAIEFKKITKLDLKTISYFSQTINPGKVNKEFLPLYQMLKKDDSYSFYWDQSFTERSKKQIKNLYYLPLFVNTNIYKNYNLKPKYDIIFAGRLNFKERIESIIDIINLFPKLKIALYCYPEHFVDAVKNLNSRDKKKIEANYKGFLVNDIALAKEINKSKIILNFTSRSGSHLNLRVFEALACEKFLLTDYRIEIPQLFTPGKDIIYYKNNENLCYLINDYLSNPNKYTPLIKAGRETVENNYSGKIAAKKIMDIVGFKRES